MKDADASRNSKNKIGLASANLQIADGMPSPCLYLDQAFPPFQQDANIGVVSDGIMRHHFAAELCYNTLRD